MAKTTKMMIHAKGLDISVLSSVKESDYISITDIAKYKSDAPDDVIKNWLRNRETIEFLGLWEQLNNSEFKPVEFDGFRKESGRNAFVLSPKKWIETTGAIGLRSKAGRYGGTFAHVDIALEFASWISPEFKLYIIKDYQRLKTDENYQQALEWNVKRELAKVNYRIHTDAIKEHLLPKHLTSQQTGYTYASEADMLNVALFGMTAKEWREQNPEAIGNIRDAANIYQLIVLVNMESMNAELIKQRMPQKDRLVYLNNMAIEQMRSLVDSAAVKRLNDSIDIPEESDK
ncbi:KilA-N domain-containing protein [Eubacteriales bacterium OttesenSCG-928-A19]|nr:KilA-N domain-containing protein [Eubacteriales bacterium OttesenSCG-928-A19]